MLSIFNSAILYFDQLNNVYEFTSQLRNVAELTKISFLSH